MAISHLGQRFVVRATCRSVSSSARAAAASAPLPAARASRASMRSSALWHCTPGCQAPRHFPQKTNSHAPQRAMRSSSSMQATRLPVPSASHLGQYTTSPMPCRACCRLSSSQRAISAEPAPSSARRLSGSKGSRQSPAGQHSAAMLPSDTCRRAMVPRHSRQPKWPHERNRPLEPRVSSKQKGQTCTSFSRRSSSTRRACASRRSAASMGSPGPSGRISSRRGATSRSCRAEAHWKSTGWPSASSASWVNDAPSSRTTSSPRCPASSTKAGAPAPGSG
mmetsp:Transcript_106926/g.302957  ORF Transcript_106926/g.302957 Transcript_106926/m.302957 type:complete len:279 (-) Transcript_106926:352-1188(-)